ncbi:DUF2147 domain-containing protein [Kordia sp. YSTF-M3]|uniref:DUF2147 domain-containing protein n=1 Tax=Kordia aestuariivivens TaxID=2759037 RepID=A0ABR7QE68_9FLAO|nr:DUF2147 domain-containing protein [Kordia aestuariivivens]MBC8756808.1 DUF2147 domain-containing protein [Kordia aestuariivivens]
MKKTTYVYLTVLLLSLQVGFAQSIIGKWKTIDDETGEAKSIVEIYEESGKIYGKVVGILNPDKRDGVCEKCSDDRKDKPVLGMLIINGLEKDDDEYRGGKILDPEKGKEYKCKLWLDEANQDKLYVRGYIAFLYRTQNWYRVD